MDNAKFDTQYACEQAGIEWKRSMEKDLGKAVIAHYQCSFTNQVAETEESFMKNDAVKKQIQQNIIHNMDMQLYYPLRYKPTIRK